MFKELTFGRPALAASIARASTLRDVPSEFLAWLGDRALGEVEWLLEDMSTFRLSQNLNALADADRTAFAGRVGAGVTDLTMNALGYTWRDNAACISDAQSPHPDFIYGGGRADNHGVVLAEAHGSFARAISGGKISGRAIRKYRRQVEPHLATESLLGRIVHGYSIAFGSKPGTSGAFLHVAETEIPAAGTKQSSDTVSPADSSFEQPPISLALATHRSNFSLMGAPSVVAWIDWIRAGGERPDAASPLSFWEIPYARRTFLASPEALWPFYNHPFWLEDLRLYPEWRRYFPERRLLRQGADDFAGWFVMEKGCAAQLLNSLSAIIRSGRENLPAVLELPCIEPAGFSIDRGEVRDMVPETEYAHALFRDGLALLGSPPPQRIVGHRTWIPDKGMQAD